MGLCEICATALQRLIRENGRDGKEAPTALAIGKHLLGSERAVYKEFEPVIDGIAGALRDDCADWPKTPAHPVKPKPEPEKPVPVKPESEPVKPKPVKQDKPKPKPEPEKQKKPSTLMQRAVAAPHPPAKPAAKSAPKLSPKPAHPPVTKKK